MYHQLIKEKRSIIVAADLPGLGPFYRLMGAINNVHGVDGVKLGFELGLRGLEKSVRIVRRYMDNRGDNFAIIYDHQKAGGDVPEMGARFAQVLKEAGVGGAIIYPHAGPTAQREWTKACFDVGLDVLTGGIMSHEKYLESEGGYVSDKAPERIYKLACEMGVKHFIIPCNKPWWGQKVVGWLNDWLGEGNYALYGLGFIHQGGKVSDFIELAGKNNDAHGIVGHAIYDKETQEDQRLAAIQMVAQIREW